MKNTIRRILKKAGSILAAAVLAFGAAVTVPAESVSAYSTSSKLAEGCYTIIPKCAQNFCIDISGAGTGNGENVQIWGIAGVDQQRFYVTNAGSNSYHITAVHSGKRLDVDNQSKSSGANIHQWAPHTGSSQKWKIVHKGNGWYTIQNAYTGKYLDIQGGGSHNGCNIWQYDGNNSAAQYFRFDAVVPENSTYELSPKCAPGSVLDIDGAGTGNGTNVQIWGRANVDQQKFNISRIGNSNYFTITACHSGKRLDVAGPSKADDANVHQWEAHSGDSQKWAFCYRGNGYYMLQNVYSGKMLDVYCAWSHNGNNVQQYSNIDNTNCAQLWSLTAAKASSKPAPAPAFQSYQGKITAKTGLNMRKSASSSSSKVTAIPRNTVVTITAEQNGWGKTSYNGKSGWISLDYVQKIDSFDVVIDTVIPASGYQYPFTSYRINTVYGKKGKSWKIGWHSGIDIVPTNGASWDVSPVHSGTVVDVNAHGSSYGNHVLIDHGDGTLSLYAHLEYLNVSPGQQVTTSTTLGKMGNTGNSSGPHLHLEIHKGRYSYPSATDPAAFLNERA
ncbi:MAG: RICIN domain-containing protein [Oscillospiraceae bacterium]|nr:RICIN domain-containing protein [Oscillospiraceae bacterium]